VSAEQSAGVHLGQPVWVAASTTSSVGFRRGRGGGRVGGYRPDELTPDGTNLGPSLRLVYRLLCSNTDLQQVEVEVLCVAPRGDLIAYAVAAARLPVRRPGRIAPTPGSARSLQGLAATSLSDRGPAMNAAPSELADLDPVAADEHTSRWTA
jgi:hypothetical protein